MIKKKIKLIFLLLFLTLSGCYSFPKNNDNPLGLELTLSDITPTQLVLTCKQSHTNFSNEVTTDLHYWIQKYEDNKWKDLEYITQVFFDETVEYSIPKNGEYYWTLVWSGIYGDLTVGTYRVKKIFKYKDKEYEYYAKFKIE
ncbi:immunoglobulin-like domain-containing protein [Thomasclavelia spiroformis]|uniref:immunoglobulin-like domain-containing protein n=1 Tax=Thomasclavelia spiroformis TaxID=29348 RepID=UPI00241DAFD4|nr:immunoglobulin-like domain-containing protein [Thomasclavelia spiroformis]MBS6114272.1 hypothetical protein [Thomasclavelia spiroformis]